MNTASPAPEQAEPPAVSETLDQLVQRARELVSAGGRRLLGIIGTPGAGKSTLCAALLDALGDTAVLVGMDGFHLADDELRRLGRRDRKGAPDTFDVDGYVALLRRLRTQSESVIYAPVFDRGIEASIGSAVPVHRDTPLVVTEGNYLLYDRHGWDAVAGQLDEAWFLDIPPLQRQQRLVLRRQSYGHSAESALAWVHGVDEANAAIVDTTRGRADLIVHITSLDRTPFQTGPVNTGEGAAP